MTEPFYIVVKEPGKPPIGRMVGNGVDSLQKIVGGYLEHIICDTPGGLALFSNEDANRLELEPNLGLPSGVIRGTCYLRSTFDEDEMNPDQMVEAGAWFRKVAL